jgi:hypothetical protein
MLTRVSLVVAVAEPAAAKVVVTPKGFRAWDAAILAIELLAAACTHTTLHAGTAGDSTVAGVREAVVSVRCKRGPNFLLSAMAWWSPPRGGVATGRLRKYSHVCVSGKTSLLVKHCCTLSPPTSTGQQSVFCSHVASSALQSGAAGRTGSEETGAVRMQAVLRH